MAKTDRRIISCNLDVEDIKLLEKLAAKTGIGFQDHVRSAIKGYLRPNKKKGLKSDGISPTVFIDSPVTQHEFINGFETDF